MSHYVAPGTALDQEARLRGNSTYLVDRVVPMLPEVLSNGLCSLKPGVDRLTKCMEVLLSKDGRVLKTRFTMEWDGREAALAEPATREREEARYWKAFNAGDVDNTGVFTGEAVGLIRDVAPAGEILRRMVREAE